MKMPKMPKITMPKVPKVKFQKPYIRGTKIVVPKKPRPY
jgi:hypothetical protein